MPTDKPIGCFICAGPIDPGAGRVTLEIEDRSGRQDSYVVCSRCGEPIVKSIEMGHVPPTVRR